MKLMRLTITAEGADNMAIYLPILTQKIRDGFTSGMEGDVSWSLDDEADAAEQDALTTEVRDALCSVFQIWAFEMEKDETIPASDLLEDFALWRRCHTKIAERIGFVPECRNCGKKKTMEGDFGYYCSLECKDAVEKG